MCHMSFTLPVVRWVDLRLFAGCTSCTTCICTGKFRCRFCVCPPNKHAVTKPTHLATVLTCLWGRLPPSVVRALPEFASVVPHQPLRAGQCSSACTCAASNVSRCIEVGSRSPKINQAYLPITIATTPPMNQASSQQWHND